MAVDDPDFRGALQGQFRYTPEYLEHSTAFPLDPLHLPLSSETFNADRPRAGVHGVFEDSLPDDWAGDSWFAVTGWTAVNNESPGYCNYWATRF